MSRADWLVCILAVLMLAAFIIENLIPWLRKRRRRRKRVEMSFMARGEIEKGELVVVHDDGTISCAKTLDVTARAWLEKGDQILIRLPSGVQQEAMFLEWLGPPNAFDPQRRRPFGARIDFGSNLTIDMAILFYKEVVKLAPLPDQEANSKQ